MSSDERRHEYDNSFYRHPNPGWCFACIKTTYKLSPYEAKSFWTCQRFKRVDEALGWRDGHAVSETYSETHSDFTVYGAEQYPQSGFARWYFAWKRDFGSVDVKWK